jgi:methyl-accepting chemotaxis protein
MHIRTVYRILAFSSFLCLCIGTASAEGLRYPAADWKWSAGDDPSWAASDFDDSSWASIALPASIKPGKPRSVFWLRTSYTIPEGAPDRLWFLVSKAGVALELYVDGVYAGSRGRLPPEFDLRATQYASMLLPPRSAQGGQTIHLALRCAYSGSTAILVPYEIGDEAAMRFDRDVANFWNGRIYALLAALCLFLGLYFIIQFLFKRSERANLYFSLTLLFLSAYLVDMGAVAWPFAAPISRALSRSGLVISMLFLLPFFMAFLGSKKAKPVLLVSMAVGLVFLLLYVAFSGDESSVSMIFTLSCAVIFVPILISAYVSVKAIRSGVVEAWPILIAVVIGIALAGHDAYYQVAGRNPFAWLQGFAFFGLDLSIFIALSMRQAKLKSDLEAYAKEIEAKTSELGDSLSRLGQAGEAAAKLSSQIEEAASRAVKAAEDSAARSNSIGKDTERQAAEALEADKLVSGLVVSIGRVNEKLGSQNESAERTAAAATELSAGAESVAQSIERTSAFTSGLAELTGSGEKAASALALAMERVSAASAGIGEVVDAVNDFAERTNLLAMNAAIEAAHSGQAGRGFAIIAGEVKKLAGSQAERADRIMEIVGEISTRVQDGARDADRLKKTLQDIASGSVETAGQLKAVRLATSEQMRASEEISSSMEALAAAIASIREESERQAGYSEQVRAAVAAIAAKAGEVQHSASSIAQDGAGLAETVGGLRELAAKGGELTAALAGWKGGKS